MEKKHRLIATLAVAALVTALVACGGNGNDDESNGSETEAAEESAIPTATPVNEKRLPLGDGLVAEEPTKGQLFSCGGESNDGRAISTGPWIDSERGTWDSTAKVSVDGRELLPSHFSTQMSGGERILSGSGIPRHPVGVFPVESDDPAYQYDPNPEELVSYTMRIVVPTRPKRAEEPSCVGAIAGVMRNGIPLYRPLDDGDQDAVARLVQDRCGGHPSREGQYHYHALSPCIEGEPEPDSAKLVGWALDGFGIYVERDADGNMLSTKDLDACHGRVSEVEWEGEQRTIYHYVASPDFPYAVGCFRGTPADESVLDLGQTSTSF